MWKYVAKRILMLIPTLLVVSFIVFWLMSMAGDPASTIMGDNATPEQIEAKREAMGLNRPLIVRYGEYIFNVMQGDLGISLYGQNVWEQFSNRIPFTLMLVGASIFLTVVMSIPLGIAAALHRGKGIDFAASALAMFGVSVPIFWLGQMLMIVFAVKLRWLPTSGINHGVLKGLILPACSSALTAMGAMTRMTRSSMLDALGADYLDTARAKGVKQRVVVWKHALKNALLPIITTIGGQFSVMIGGGVMLETVFGWPGIGNLVVTSMRSNDYMMVTGCVLIITILSSLGVLLTDVAYAFVDPRIKAQYSGK